MALVLAYGLAAVEYIGEGEYTAKLLRATVKSGDTFILPGAEAIHLKKTGLFVDAGDNKAAEAAKAKLSAKKSEIAALRGEAKATAEEAERLKSEEETTAKTKKIAPAQQPTTKSEQ